MHTRHSFNTLAMSVGTPWTEESQTCKPASLLCTQDMQPSLQDTHKQACSRCLCRSTCLSHAETCASRVTTDCKGQDESRTLRYGTQCCENQWCQLLTDTQTHKPAAKTYAMATFQICMSNLPFTGHTAMNHITLVQVLDLWASLLDCFIVSHDQDIHQHGLAVQVVQVLSKFWSELMAEITCRLNAIFT